MPTGIYQHKPLSEKTKKKMRENNNGGWFKKGHQGYKSWLGKEFSEKHIKKLSEAKKGLILSNITRKKMSEAHQKEKSYLWKGGKTDESKIIRHNIEYRLWREAVFARDNWTCQKYRIKGGKLHPHHIQNFAQYPELRFAIDNGITLSEKAHKEFHKIYGKKNNTKEQLEKFLTDIKNPKMYKKI